MSCNREFCGYDCINNVVMLDFFGTHIVIVPCKQRCCNHAQMQSFSAEKAQKCFSLQCSPDPLTGFRRGETGGKRAENRGRRQQRRGQEKAASPSIPDKGSGERCSPDRPKVLYSFRCCLRPRFSALAHSPPVFFSPFIHIFKIDLRTCIMPTLSASQLPAKSF